MEWISVNDRLPEDDLEYLTYDKGDNFKVLQFYKGRFLIEVRDYYPTHWMPLPNPPKQ